MRKKTMRCAVLAAAAGMMLQFGGGCLGDAGQLFLRELVVGAGRAVGAIPGALITTAVGGVTGGTTAGG